MYFLTTSVEFLNSHKPNSVGLLAIERAKMLQEIDRAELKGVLDRLSMKELPEKGR